MLPAILFAVIVVALIYFLFVRKSSKNWFTTRGRYKSFNPDFLPTVEQWRSVERTTSFDGELEIVKGSGGVAAEEAITISFLFSEACKKWNSKPCLAYQTRSEDGTSWDLNFISYTQYNENARRFGRALMALGFEKHNVITVLGHNSPNWFFAQTGAMLSGGICSGLYPTSYPGAILYIANHCEARIGFLDSREQLDKYLEIEGDLEFLEYLVCWDDQLDLKQIETKKMTLLSLDEFLSGADEVSEEALEERMDAQRPGHCCLLSYTSGTTGNPKAVMLSHDNLIWTCRSVWASNTRRAQWREMYPPQSQMRSISYLPLNHLAGSLGDWLSPLQMSLDYDNYYTLYFTRPDWKKTMFETVQVCRPTNFVGVPRIWEKITEGVMSKIGNASPIRRNIFNFAMYVGKKLYRNIQANGSGEYPIGYELVHKIVFHKILSQIGLDQAQSLTSGGAPLSEKTKEFFGAMGFLLGNIYGMTETAASGTSSRDYHFLSDAVGIVSDGVELRIEHESGRDPPGHGEICIRARGVMMGYLKDAEKTAETIDEDGWLHTGDAGRMEGQILWITGRIKELIVTAGGENIAPVPIEHYILHKRPGIGQIVVVGDEHKYLTALVAVATEVDPETGDPSDLLAGHAKMVNPAINRVSQVKDDPAWMDYVRSTLKEYNANRDICVSNACKIQYFSFLDEMLSQSQGTLGPTLKTKRHVIHSMFADQIDSMYTGQGIPVNV